MPEGVQKLFVSKELYVIVKTHKLHFSHQRPFMKADVNPLDHRPDGKYCIQDKKRQYKPQSCQQVFAFSFFTHLISSLQLNAHNSFAVCKGKESLYAPPSLPFLFTEDWYQVRRKAYRLPLLRLCRRTTEYSGCRSYLISWH